MLGTEGSVDLGRIEANDHRSVDDCDRGREIAEALKLCYGIGFLGHVSFSKRNLLLRKILFRTLAEHSARLREYRYGLLHFRFLERLPDASSAQL